MENIFRKSVRNPNVSSGRAEQGGDSLKNCTTGNRISVVTVTFNSSAALPAMLHSIPVGVPVIVVDNASEDAAKTNAIATGFGAQVVLNQENVGFGRACNIGAAQVTTDLVLFLNPDAVVVEGALACLAKAADRYPKACAFNPAFESTDGGQILRRKSQIDPTKWKPPHGGGWWPPYDQEMPVLSGAALLVRMADFNSIGGFDPDIFLYYEDDDLSLRLRSSCGPLMFIRKARIVHDGGNSSGSDLEILRKKSYWVGYSRVYASLKHGRPLSFERAVIRAVHRVCSPTKLFSTRERIERIGYLHGVLSARHLSPSLVSRMKKRFSL